VTETKTVALSSFSDFSYRRTFIRGNTYDIETRRWWTLHEQSINDYWKATGIPIEMFIVNHGVNIDERITLFETLIKEEERTTATDG